MDILCEKVRKIEERVWQEELQRGKHLPGYGGYVSAIEDSPANDIQLPRRHFPDMEDWGGKQIGYGGHKPMVLACSNPTNARNNSHSEGFHKFCSYQPDWQRPDAANPRYMWNLDNSPHSGYRTTSGEANYMCQRQLARMRKRPPIVKKTVPGEIPLDTKGVKGFFQEAGNDPRVGTSEQGKKDAEMFFAHIRPLEGTIMAMNSTRSIRSGVMQ